MIYREIRNPKMSIVQRERKREGGREREKERAREIEGGRERETEIERRRIERGRQR